MRVRYAKMNRGTLLFCLLVTLVMGLAGCGPKATVITAQTFTDTLIEKGYAVLDMSQNLDPKQVKSLTVAMKGLYRIEFYEIPLQAAATDSFNNYVEALEKADNALEQGDSKVLYKKKTSDYSVYRQLSDSKYVFLSRIKNTLLSVEASSADQAEIDEIFKALGYYFEM